MYVDTLPQGTRFGGSQGAQRARDNFVKGNGRFLGRSDRLSEESPFADMPLVLA